MIYASLFCVAAKAVTDRASPASMSLGHRVQGSGAYVKRTARIRWKIERKVMEAGFLRCVVGASSIGIGLRRLSHISVKITRE